jgi:ribose transport system substrate-binding protein
VKVVKEITGQFDRNQAIGAMEIQAIAAHGKTKQVKLIGFDGALEATQHILQDDMQATIAQDPYGMAEKGVEEAVAKLHGKPVKRNINTGAKLIMPQNTRKYFNQVRGKLGHTGRGLGASQ